MNLRMFLAAVALIPEAALAASGGGDTLTGTATAQAIVPLVLRHNNGSRLRFGRVSAGNSGTVIVSPNGARSTTGDVGLVPGSTVSADSFVVTGPPGQVVAIVGHSGTARRSGRSMSFVTTPSVATLTLPASGTSTFTVGGELSVSAGQLVGNYTGNYTVTAAYN